VGLTLALNRVLSIHIHGEKENIMKLLSTSASLRLWVFALFLVGIVSYSDDGHVAAAPYPPILGSTCEAADGANCCDCIATVSDTACYKNTCSNTKLGYKVCVYAPSSGPCYQTTAGTVACSNCKWWFCNNVDLGMCSVGACDPCPASGGTPYESDQSPPLCQGTPP
jgi:hypothetical protein